MNRLKQKLKSAFFTLLGKDPEAVVVSFWTGDPALARRMAEEVQLLLPTRRHFNCVTVNAIPDLPDTTAIRLTPGSTWSLYRQLRRRFRRLRIGMAPVLFTTDAAYRPLRRAAFLLAPLKILAYNARLERHHLRCSTWIASWLFLHGVALDRIFLRPAWLCPFKRDRSVFPSRYQVLDGRPLSLERPRIAVLSPYFPYPLSHGGAVRIYHLLREAAREFDIFLFSFAENNRMEDIAPVVEFCAKAVLLPVPRYRQPRWATLAPPEVCEFRSELAAKLLNEFRSTHDIELIQVEYTHLAPYGGDILVEHDVTFDLFRQVRERNRTLSARWDYWRWRRFETRAASQFRRVVFMSEKDAALLPHPGATVIPNGCALERFRPEPEPAGQRLLFIGSFRHFPNIVAYRFLTGQVWPLLKDRFPDMTLTVVAGLDPLVYWRQHAGTLEPYRDDRIHLAEFVRDVRPLYAEANLVLAPTLVSAGTNVKVLEAMAMERAVVSTPSGCAGLGLTHGESVWISGTAAEFAEGVARLTEDPALRHRIAVNARTLAEERYDWRSLGAAQRRLWRNILAQSVELRPATEDDLDQIRRIQDLSPEASHWEPDRYLAHDCQLALVRGRTAGFLVMRTIAPDENEILNLAVDPAFRRRGVASRLLAAALERAPGAVFLEVRESNQAARELYEKSGFRRAGLRPRYYDYPPESAVVMRFESC